MSYNQILLSIAYILNQDGLAITLDGATIAPAPTAANPTPLPDVLPGSCTGIPRIANGITLFPGGFPIYRNGKLVGGIGASGDGSDQSDLVAFLGLSNGAAVLNTGTAAGAIEHPQRHAGAGQFAPALRAMSASTVHRYQRCQRLRGQVTWRTPQQKRRFPRLGALAAATTFCICGNVHAQTVQMTADVLEMFGALPAPTYDPNESQIPRRRPGHPYEPPPEFTIQNPNGVPPAPIDQVGSFLPVPNRWRIMETLGYKFPWYDPYNQNIWKGDKPIDGKDHFLSLNFIAETVDNARSVPTPVGPQASSQPGQNDVLGRIHQNVLSQTIIASADYYKGDTTFKPPEYEFKATLALNYNRVDVQQVRAVQIDPRFGQTRDDGYIGVQELFYLKDLRTLDERYDFDEVRIGVQPFSSDFRGFLFQDSQLGVRFFGTRDNNRWQYNIAYVPAPGEGHQLPASTT